MTEFKSFQNRYNQDTNLTDWFSLDSAIGALYDLYQIRQKHLLYSHENWTFAQAVRELGRIGTNIDSGRANSTESQVTNMNKRRNRKLRDCHVNGTFCQGSLIWQLQKVRNEVIVFKRKIRKMKGCPEN